MDILATFADNKTLVDEVRKVIEKHFTESGLRTEAVSDELLGQQYRARLVGMQKVEAAFDEIATHRTRKEILRRQVNPAR